MIPLAQSMEYRDFLDHVAEMVEVPAGSLTGNEKVEDLEGWTSLALVSFIAFGDERFGKTLSPKSVGACQTIDDLARLVGVTSYLLKAP